MKACSRALTVLLLLAVGVCAQTTFDVSGGAGSTAANWFLGTGGIWATVNGTAMLSPHFGISADFSTRANKEKFGDRPYLADVNFAMRGSRARVTPELDLGWGGVGIPSGGGCLANAVVPPLCSFSGREFHNGGHLSFSVIVQLSHHVFIRPIYHLYVGKGMGHPEFFGALIGYSF